MEIAAEGRSLNFRGKHLGITLRLHFSERSIGEVLEQRSEVGERAVAAALGPQYVPGQGPTSRHFNPQMAHILGYASPDEKSLVCTVTGKIEGLNGLSMTANEAIFGSNSKRPVIGV